MQKRYVDILTRKFPSLSRLEIEQTVLLSELRYGEGPLSAVDVKCDLLNMIKANGLREKRFVSLESLSADDYERHKHSLSCTDELLEQRIVEEEWETLYRGLPALARKLACIAKQEATNFENVPGGIWTGENLKELRRRIKREFNAWAGDKSQRKYRLARWTLVKALHRNRKK